MARVFVAGYPGDVGGANTECWHTVKLWRSFALEVTLLPTWAADDRWRRKLAGIGCQTASARPDRLGDVPGLAGSVVVSFCNSRFLRQAERFRELGCRVVWVGCMTWLFARERLHYRRWGPFDRYVFQSRYQQDELLPQLARYGVRPEQCHLIRGAFSIEEFPFRPRPHKPGTPLVIGRLSRAAVDKFSPNTWAVYGRARHPIRARVMAWDNRLQRKLGVPPDWAECLPAAAEPPQQFLGKLHAMVQLNGGAAENWPRSGLEAVAAGVPVVAENRWGWREMIRHGETGVLADSDGEVTAWIDRLADDEDLRLRLAQDARRGLEQELAEPAGIWAGWEQLFGELA